MAHHKLLWDDDFEEQFTLIAIHSTEESFKLAYLLNKKLNFQLKREALDVIFTSKATQVIYPLYKFEEPHKEITHYLVGNTSKTIALHASNNGGLFDLQPFEKSITTYLLPEFKKADFFLKIEAEIPEIEKKNIVNQIHKIKEVISCYIIDTNTIKSNNNLIFN